MAPKAPANIPAPPPPPAPAAPVVDSTPATPVVPPPPPAETPLQTDQRSDAEKQAGATNVNEAQPGTSGGTGPGEIDGGAAEKSNSDQVDAEASAAERKRQLDAASPNGAVTTNAEAAGAAKASDYKPRDPDLDDEFAEVPEDKFGKRLTKISHSAFKAGRRGVKLGKQRKSMTDAEWAVYQASYARGVQQGEADKIENSVERIERIERALGLMIPGAPDPYDEDDE